MINASDVVSRVETNLGLDLIKGYQPGLIYARVSSAVQRLSDEYGRDPVLKEITTQADTGEYEIGEEYDKIISAVWPTSWLGLSSEGPSHSLGSDYTQDIIADARGPRWIPWNELLARQNAADAHGSAFSLPYAWSHKRGEENTLVLGIVEAQAVEAGLTIKLYCELVPYAQFIRTNDGRSDDGVIPEKARIPLPAYMQSLLEYMVTEEAAMLPIINRPDLAQYWGSKAGVEKEIVERKHAITEFTDVKTNDVMWPPYNRG